MRKILVLMTAAVFLLALAVLATFSRNSAPRPIVVTAPFFGNRESPVELVLFEDFKCDACHLFSRNMLPHIVAEYLTPQRISLKIVPLGFLHDSKILANAASKSIDWLLSNSSLTRSFYSIALNRKLSMNPLRKLFSIWPKKMEI